MTRSLEEQIQKKRNVMKSGAKKGGGGVTELLHDSESCQLDLYRPLVIAWALFLIAFCLR